MRHPRALVLFLLITSGGPALLPPRASAWQRTLPDLVGLLGFGGDLGESLDTVALGDDVVAVGSNQFIVLRLAGASGQVIWRYDIGSGASVAAAVDAAGDVVAAGFRGSTYADPLKFTVVKLSGTTGSELWSRDVMGSTAGSAAASGVALDPAGDVVVAGFVSDAGTGEDAAFVKLSGTDGSEMWRQTIDGVGYADDAVAGKVDPFGDVIGVASLVTSPGTASVSRVVKLAGGTGSEIWRKDFPDDPPVHDVFRAVGAIVVTGDGDVATEGDTGSVFMLSGADGSELWSHDGSGQQLLAPPRLALRPSDDVVASDLQLGVVVLGRADGHELWRRTVGCQSFDVLDAMTVDAGGDVVVAGSTDGCRPSLPYGGGFLTIAKLSGADGTEQWRRNYTAEEPGIFSAHALAVAPPGDFAVAGRLIEGRANLHPSVPFTVLDFSGSNGALALCGDGYVDMGEECDDGNTTDGDCCSSACRSAPDGTACQDGDLCTTDDACQGGSCRGGPPLPCEPCGTCDPSSGCLTGLPFECRAPTETDAAALRLEAGAAHKSLAWDWSSGAATTKADFGDPRTTTSYALCVFGGPDSDEVLVRGAAPAGAVCSRTVGCWRAIRRGFVYRSRSAKPDGLSSVSLRAGAGGRAEVVVKGRGAHLDAPVLPLTAPVTVQLRKIDGSPPCWSARLDRVLTNRPHRFVARGN